MDQIVQSELNSNKISFLLKLITVHTIHYLSWFNLAGKIYFLVEKYDHETKLNNFYWFIFLFLFAAGSRFRKTWWASS